MQQDKICSKCKSRHGFCKHTIETKYKDYAQEMPDNPTELKDSWEYLNRGRAIVNTERLMYLQITREQDIKLNLQQTKIGDFSI